MLQTPYSSRTKVRGHSFSYSFSYDPARNCVPGTVSPELASVPGTGVVLWRQPVHHLEVGNVGVVLRVVGDQRQPMCQSDGSILQIEIR